MNISRLSTVSSKVNDIEGDHISITEGELVKEFTYVKQHFGELQAGLPNLERERLSKS